MSLSKVSYFLSFIIVPMFLLNGCQPFELERKRVENRRGANDLVMNAIKKENDLKDKFLGCAKEYGMKKSSLSINPSDIAEASIAECTADLTLYEMNRTTYYSMTSLQSGRYGYDPRGEDEKVKRNVQNDLKELVETGKRMVINEIINNKKAPQ